MEITIDDLNFLIFIIPGFITVWSFRYLTGSKKAGDFEFLGLSFFWGIVTFGFYQLISSQAQIQKLLLNPYAAAVVLSIFGSSLGLIGSWMSRWKFFRKISNISQQKDL